MPSLVNARLKAIPFAARELLRYLRAVILREPDRRRAALEFARRHAKPGDPASVLAALDRFAREDRFLMNVGPEKGKVLEAELVAIGPEARVLELGTFVGYSAILMARHLSGRGRIVSLDVSPEATEVARAMASLAGVGDRIDFRTGRAEQIYGTRLALSKARAHRVALAVKDRAGSEAISGRVVNMADFLAGPGEFAPGGGEAASGSGALHRTRIAPKRRVGSQEHDPLDGTARAPDAQPSHSSIVTWSAVRVLGAAVQPSSNRPADLWNFRSTAMAATTSRSTSTPMRAAKSAPSFVRKTASAVPLPIFGPAMAALRHDVF